MAKKETTKKAVSKKGRPKKMVNEVVETTIENKIEEIKVDEAKLEELKNESEVNVYNEPQCEYEPTVEEVKESIKVLETMNGDPSVVTPTDKIHEEALADTFKETKPSRKLDNMFGYSWNGQEIDYI